MCYKMSDARHKIRLIYKLGTVHPYGIRGRPLEIPGGGGGGNSPQKFVQRKIIRAAIMSEKKKSCKQTAKCK
jgi:hypothetical protein